MRALRVLGLAEDGDNLVCQDAASGELFTIPADERLRAATRGDLSRLGQLEIELEPQLRPREIQERIRGGASVAQVAAAANTSINRIERYAYPILLERSTMAEKARLSHPMIDGNPTRKTLEELVLGTLSERGAYSGVQWDAYRDDSGSWVVVLTWQVGRSENHAHWEIRTGPRTNTLKPRDDAARDLINPAPRPLHTITEPSFVDVARRITAGSSPVADRSTGDGAAEPTTVAGDAGTESARTAPTRCLPASRRHPPRHGRPPRAGTDGRTDCARRSRRGAAAARQARGRPHRDRQFRRSQQPQGGAARHARLGRRPAGRWAKPTAALTHSNEIEQNPPARRPTLLIFVDSGRLTRHTGGCPHPGSRPAGAP